MLIPQYLASHNKAHQHRPYHDFKNLIIGSLVPHTVPYYKKEKQHWELLIIKAIVLAALLAAMPYLAGAIIGASSGLGFMALTATLDALGDAAIQGLAIEAGIQTKFSWAEVLETGVTGGVMAGIPAPETLAQYAASAIAIGTTNASIQLAEMKLGLKDKFDTRALILQMTAAVASAKIGQTVKGMQLGKAANTAVNTASGAAVNAVLGTIVTGQPPDFRFVGANAVGSAVGNKVGDSIANSPNTSPTANDPLLPVDMEVPDATLPLPGPRYGEASYALSEMNRQHMAIPQNFAPRERYIPNLAELETKPTVPAAEKEFSGLDRASQGLLTRPTKEQNAVALGITTGVLVPPLIPAIGTVLGTLSTAAVLGPIGEAMLLEGAMASISSAFAGSRVGRYLSKLGLFKGGKPGEGAQFSVSKKHMGYD